MTLSPGTELGHYAIVGVLGAGGMGEVYRARDRQLDRDVAIKVLPAHLSSDPEALARFEREAKAVAALSHPNILAIHEFGRTTAGPDGAVLSYAVMELLEGSTLRDRLTSGALPSSKVVQIGTDIAQGLAAAHARGLVHRDLKPENVFVTTDGRVKILDFGLALDATAAAPDANSATALRRTDPGTVLGTVGYMAPEQVRGQTADHRSDVFALGCVLYELSTGRKAFERETAAETMTAILREDPPAVTRDSGAAPAAIEPVIRHCLEKQPDERFQSARDLAFALQALAGASTSSGSSPAVAAAAARPRSRLTGIVPMAVGGAIVAAAFLLYQAFGSTGPAGKAPPFFQQITDDAGVESNPAISPDGTSVAFVKSTVNGSDIYVQRVGGRNAILVAGDPQRSENAPAFSPDGTSIAFHVGGDRGGIFVAGATGESARRVTDFGFHPAWSPDGTQLLFCTEAIGSPASRTSTSSLWVVDAKGGTPAKIYDGDAVEPAWSPSGSRIAFWAVDTGQRDLYTIPAAGGARTAVTLDAALDWAPEWSADGHLYFASDRGGTMNIWRVPMSEATGSPTGDPEPVTSGVMAAVKPRLSKDGTRLVFQSVEFSQNPAAMTFDPATERLGQPRQIMDRTGVMMVWDVSPDGEWLALGNLGERKEDVFVARRDGTGLRRLTDDEFRDRIPAWSPDGTELAFYSNRTDNYAIWAIKPDGSGLRQLTEEPPGNNGNLLYPTYSPSGDRLLAARARTPETMIFDPRRDWSAQTPERLSVTLPDGTWLIPTAWSPDGRRLAGAIVNSSGAPEAMGVYELATNAIKRFDFPGPLRDYLWLPDSRRLIYLHPTERTMWLLDVDTGAHRALLENVSFGTGLAATRDGRTIYAGLTRSQADIWMMEFGGAAER